MTNSPRIAIVTDSTADLPFPLLRRFDIRSVPLNIWIDGQQYLDRVTIDPPTFIDLLANSNDFPTTSQPSVGAFQHVYEELADSYDEIVSIHLSSRLSGTYQSAVLAAETVAARIPVKVVDTGTVSMALGFAVLEAAKMASAGGTLEQVACEALHVAKRCDVIFLVDTLEYLRRGGRIGRAAELMGSMLRVKPILTVADGMVSPLARTRTRPRAIATVAAMIRELAPVERIAVLSTSGTEDLETFISSLAEFAADGNVVHAELSPVLSAHTGPGCIGIVALKETNRLDEVNADD